MVGKERLFLAAGMRDSFRTEVMFHQDETRNKGRNGVDLGPGHRLAGCSRLRVGKGWP